jgi:hypothetical protein
MTIKIYDKANGMLQFSLDADTPEAAWTAFREELGYDKDEPFFDRSHYAWTEKDQINDVSECRDFR